jgi:hypothetical protein
MRKIASFFCVLLTLLFLNACSDESRLGYLELSGRILLFNPRVATATYVVTLSVVKQPPTGSKIVAMFDNPAGGAALKMEQSMRENQTTIAFESESLLCIKKGRPYAFHIELFGPDGALLQKVSSSITSSLDQSVLPDLPLVEGPGYEPNPALKSNDAGAALRQRAGACPA